MLSDDLGKEVDLIYALLGKVLGVAGALLGGYTEEHAKHSLLHLTDPARLSALNASKSNTPVRAPSGTA